jgi:hypothetical protein
MDSDLLILDYIVLHPRWRGLKRGLLATRKLVDLLGGGCSLAVIHIGPAQQKTRQRLALWRMVS